jgi:hypothetical protein
MVRFDFVVNFFFKAGCFKEKKVTDTEGKSLPAPSAAPLTLNGATRIPN